MTLYVYSIAAIFVLMFKHYMTECPYGCEHCTGHYKCSKCWSTHYLNGGNCYHCSDSCVSCDGYKCTACLSGWFGHRCESRCLPNCKLCDDRTFCQQCESGFYGQKCDQYCNHCIENKCDTRACKIGCKQGYYVNEDSGEKQCLPCLENCTICKSSRKCTVCKEGYVLHKFKNEEAFCYECSNAKQLCGKKCIIKNCRNCEVQNGTALCTECKQGYKRTGGKCLQNSEKCSKGCSTKCDLFGACKGKCVDGWTGRKCEQKCPGNCRNCSRSNRNICQRCKDGFYKQSCNVECSSFCKKLAGVTKCRIDDGYCENGCENNFWGHFCNITCPDNCAFESGRYSLCVRDNGSCSNGCKEGFDGVKCTERFMVTFSSVSSDEELGTSKEAAFSRKETTTNYVERSSEASRQDTTVNIVVIGSIVAGGAALISLTSLLFAWLAQRRRKPHHAENDNRRGKSNDEGSINVQPVTPGNEDCLYAQVNKLNKRNNGSKEEAQMATCGVAFDLEVQEVVIDDTDLEELEDINISSIESGVNISTSDTYYNTASLLRSRIEVSNLCDYTKNKTDYKKEFERLPVGLTRACTEGLKPKNRVKNRYNGIYAYDATRVVLTSGNYVNANFIDGHKKYPAYIASLGPTKNTMNNFATFWEIIWQANTCKVVMLTNLDEAKKMKCEQYWPAPGNENHYGDYKVRCMAEKGFSEFIIREFIVERGKETREVTQYQYTAWPDKIVPDSVASLLEFRDKVEQKQLTTAGPMMVHCSAGIGRTGTYIALDILIKEGKDDQSVDIFGCVNALRGQRVHLVQNLEQYVYLHHCVLYALSCAPEPLPVSSMAHFTSDERLSTQHKAFVSLQHLTNRDKKMGTKNVTRKENRTGADIPDDKHRVRLGLIEKDYINAVYVNGYQEYNKFILAQTPLQGTLEDFASMLYQEQCSCVVCLDDENVIDKSIVQYLPSVNKVVTFGQFQLICTDIDRKQDFISRKLKVSRIGVSLSEEVKLFHYQFKGWSSIDCVPRSVQSFLNLVTDVEKTYQSPNSKHPIVVHCSTGAERSGLFCAVSILLEKVAVEKEVSVLNTVCQVCSRRRSAFQDIEHLRFCYNCVEQISEVSDSSTYYNYRNM